MQMHNLYYIYYIYIYIRVVRRALNLLRASFSPIFQYFSAVNFTRVSFSPIFQYFLTYVYRDRTVLNTKRVENAVFQSLDIFSVIVHASETQNIPT